MSSQVNLAIFDVLWYISAFKCEHMQGITASDFSFSFASEMPTKMLCRFHMHTRTHTHTHDCSDSKQQQQYQHNKEGEKKKLAVTIAMVEISNPVHS